MTRLEDPVGKIASSRRNLLQFGAIATAALVASATKSEPVEAAICTPESTAAICRCFLKGTAVETISGATRVEDLVAGDVVPTIFGGTRPIQWIGRYLYKKNNRSESWVRDVLPVRIARSALAPGVPQKDLLVSPYHALFVDGVLIPAGDLVNGTTITIDGATELDELEYFHIKLEAHDVIYAEGAPCETLLTVDEGAVNFAEYFRQYGAPMTEEAPCAPLLGFNGGRSELKSRFRSAMAPWIDRRNQLDIIRDRLEERGVALLREAPELVI